MVLGEGYFSKLAKATNGITAGTMVDPGSLTALAG